MRILGTVFFLSFLAGKLKSFERTLLAENKKKKLAHASFLAGNLNFEQNFT